MGRARSRASRGSIGGASGDGGTEYRRGVAAYAAACGLGGAPLGGLEIPDADARVASIILETDEPVDDIRITFDSGWVADVQAKRTLRKGPVLDKAVAQWVEAGRAGIDPRQRLVIASADLNGPMKALRSVLSRQRLQSPGAPTPGEAAILEHVEGLLEGLTNSQRDRVLQAAVIWEISVEEPDGPGAGVALALLGNAGFSITRGEASRAWGRLLSTAGRLARRRGGYDLADWLSDLRAAGLVVETTRDTPAGDLEKRREVLERYGGRLVREAQELDLRALGAQLPPLTLDKADARVLVDTDPDEDLRNHSDLLWAFLRRHRVVLTGLPGAGKSTAIRQAAGRLAQRLLEQVRGEQAGDPGYPFPVRASLKDINALGTDAGFRDRMVSVAIRDHAVADRDVLRFEIEDRLDRGLPIALFLDSLDETYDDRAKVVADVNAFLAGLSDPFVLIATRDIAYGQAATLGWTGLRLLPPEQLEALVTSVLQTASEHWKVPVDERAEWVSSRNQWVRGVLDKDRVLVQTPLIPTLLALLAVKRTPERLPALRAEVLEAVVTDVMDCHEVPRQNGHPRASPTGAGVGTAAMHAYATEAMTILDRGGIASFEEVTTAVAATIKERWYPSAPGLAQDAADGAVRFLDGTGIFLWSEPDDTVSARMSLFAEIGDALHAIQNPAETPAWVSRRITGRQLEPIVLAAALDETVNRAWQEELPQRSDDLELARAMARSHAEGTRFADNTLKLLRLQLLASIERCNRNGWSDWSRLMSLGVPDDLIERAVGAAARYSSSHQMLAIASISLQDEAAESGSADEAPLLELLSLRSLPKSAQEPNGRQGRDGIIDNTLADTQLAAATALLLRKAPGAVDAIRQLMFDHKTWTVLKSPLMGLLRAHGHEDVAKTIVEEKMRLSGTDKAFDRLTDLYRDAERYPHFLRLIADARTRGLTTRQRVRLGELGDFLETLDMSEMGVISLYRQSDDFLRHLIDLTCDLFRFDRTILATEAQTELDRLDTDESLETYSSLFDTAEPRSETDWSSVHDPDAAVDLLMKLFSLSPDQAWFAARCLSGSRVAALRAEPLLRDLIPKLDLHPQHQQAAASALASLPTSPEPDTWSDNTNPILRRIAARTAVAVREGRITERFQAFLADDDGYVRQTAVKALATTDLTELQAVLEELASQEQPGWRCLHCATDNPPGTRSCQKSGCPFAAPDPAAKAKELLDQIRPDLDNRA